MGELTRFVAECLASIPVAKSAKAASDISCSKTGKMVLDTVHLKSQHHGHHTVRLFGQELGTLNPL